MSNHNTLKKDDLYHSLFNSIKDCVVLFKAVKDGLDFEFVDLNSSAELTESINKKDVIGKTITEVYPNIKDFGLLKVFQEVYADGNSRLLPISFYEDERIAGWRENHVYKLNEEYIFSVYNDLTKEKQVEEDLKLSAKVFETSLEGILITDKDSKILKVNKAFCEMSGHSEDDILGLKSNILRSNIYPNKFYAQMWDKLKIDGSWQGEIWDRKKDGSSFAVFLNISIIYDEENNIKNYVAIYLDITEKKKIQDEIYKLAYFDTLTGLSNRSQFDISIQNHINIADRNKEKFSLLFLDLDNFKYINDTCGHDVGDLLLIEVATRIQKVLRKGDLFARLGGDEFVIISNSINSDNETIVLCNRILEIFSQEFIIKNNKFHIGCSIGISIFPIDGKDKNTLFKSADTAMYQSKKNGKNRFYFHSQDMNKEFIRKLELDTFIRKAINDKEFEMYFQPKICTDSKNICGAEALIRWNSPVLGFVSPVEFIPYAEETGLIIPIGNFVLESVFAKVKELEDKGYNLSIALNISSVQLEDEKFTDQVKSLIASTKCNPEMLEFEITESKIMTNVEENITKLLLIKEMGIKISIDDFGTGYSSMESVK